MYHHLDCAAATTPPPLSALALGTLLRGAVKVKAFLCLLIANLERKWHTELANNQVVAVAAPSVAKFSCPTKSSGTFSDNKFFTEGNLILICNL